MLKTVIVIACSLVSVYAYVPYIKKTLQGEIKPHFYTWFTCSVVSVLANILMFESGGGVGVLPTAIGGVSSVLVACASFKNRGRLTTLDGFFVVLSLAAIPLWLSVENADVSSVIVSWIMFLAFVPSMFKALDKPHEENAKQYLISSIRFAFSCLGLTSFSIATLAFPLTMALINALIVLCVFIGGTRSKAIDVKI
ncbi:hypothetical protein L8R85_02145 [Vibrio splendidus]|uniref:Uncharacterized protein n=2 Tax=Vibrio TaxID=662 RepID=A0AA43JUB7_VIBSP|nr:MULTISPECIES: hypothetical protein [Vibrio]MDH5919817.1 hypothetical protein [Vibrio splendidus]TCN05624.1 hypothetical protein EDB35_116122 [Vibrio crassostreae]CAK2764664.1 PQ loop repeat protein [Vibrio crassostreae]CAK2840743.1 PQ loop repeat protein [Vibrio crassostreae]CAK3255762.1 PQ loop repeat protein [Vibrio crassostreae]